MSYFKIVKNPCNNEHALQRLCDYIIDPAKTNGWIGGRGLDPYHAYEEISGMQTLWRKDFGRRAYHCLLSFGNEEAITIIEAQQIAFQVAGLFFLPYQVLYSIHVTQAHLHIHFAINTVSLIDGSKLNLGYADLARIEERIGQIVGVFL